jgi:hypothetical protein
VINAQREPVRYWSLQSYRVAASPAEVSSQRIAIAWDGQAAAHVVGGLYRADDPQAGGAKKIADNPMNKISEHDYGPMEPKAGSNLRRTHTRWYTVPTSSHTRPETLSFARRPKSGRTTRLKKRKLQAWRLDGRRYPGAGVAAVAPVVCQQRGYQSE